MCKSINNDEQSVSRRQGIGRFDAQWREDNKTGFMHITMYPSKPGILLYNYRRADGSIAQIRELVTKEVLHDAAIRASLENKVVLNEHRFSADGEGIMIDAANARKEMSGWTVGAHEIADDGEHTRIDGVIVDGDLKNMIKSGKVQVSPGYDVIVDNTPGEHPEYGRYDARQTHRDYNHIAVTWKGRTGPTVAIRSDAADEQNLYRFDAWEQADAEITTEDRMSDEVKQASNDAQAQMRQDAQEIALLSQQVNKLQSEKEQLQGRVDALETELQTHKDRDINAEVNARLALISQAKPHLPESTKFDGMSDLEIKKAVVSAKYDSIEFDGMSNDHVHGMFTVAVREPKAQTETNGGKQVREAYDSAPAPELDPVSAAYQRQIEKMMKGIK